MEVPRASVPPAQISARPASTDDLRDIADLHLEAAEHMGRQRGGAQLVAERRRGTTIAVVTDSVGRELARELSVVLVGCIGSAVVGYGVLQLPGRPGKPPPQTSASIRELFVEPAAREVGVGASLLAHMVSSTSKHGCDGLDATVLPGDRATKNFFEDHAMAARAIVVHRSTTP